MRSELRHGQQMAMHCNFNRDPKKRSEPWKALDFMNFTDPEPADNRNYSDEELEAYAGRVFGK